MIPPELDTFFARRCEFAAVLDRIRRQPISLPVPFQRSPCDACGYPTMMGSYDYCPVCHWEDDPDQGWYGARSPDEPNGGPNGPTSLTEARINFERHGSMFAPDDPYPQDYARAQERKPAADRLVVAYERLRQAKTTLAITEAVLHIRETEGPGTFEEFRNRDSLHHGAS